MNNIQQFVDLVGQGDNVQAQETLNNILSNKAFEALEFIKKDIAANLFAEEAEELEEDAEQLDEISLDKASDAYAARVKKMDDTASDKNFDKAVKTHKHISNRYGANGAIKAGQKAGDVNFASDKRDIYKDSKK